MKIQPTSAPPISNIPKSYPKPCEIWAPADREILSFIFYRNRISSDTSTHSKTRDENGPKMSPNVSCLIEASHMKTSVNKPQLLPKSIDLETFTPAVPMIVIRFR